MAEAINTGGIRPVTPASTFDQRLIAYRIAKARLDLACALAAGETGSLPDEELDALVDVQTDAVDALLTTQCVDHRDLWNKIDVIVQHEVWAGWHLATEIMVLLKCDAERLLDRTRIDHSAPLQAVS